MARSQSQDDHDRPLPAILSLAIPALLISCAPPPAPPDPGTLQQLRGRYESTLCDTPEFVTLSEDIAEVNARRRRGTPPVVSVAAENLPVSTVHDCQRLVTGDRLGPLTALFVSRERVVDEAGLVAGAVVADIVNYGPGSYSRLGIEPGLNCLWLQRDSASPDRWFAAMLQPLNGECVGTTPGAPDDTTLLRVVRHPAQGVDLPATGRWMWDPDGGQQFIGLQCGMAWCDVGPAGFKTNTSIVKTEDVPGWHDEQRLSFWDENAKVLRLSNLVGRIVPGPDLPDMNRTAPEPKTEGHAATITLEGDDPEARALYHTKLALNKGADTHEVRLKWGKKLAFALPPWKTVHRLRVGNHLWTKMVYSDHAHAGPNAVRWAWSESDEGVWAPCDEGCCKGNSAGRAYP